MDRKYFQRKYRRKCYNCGIEICGINGYKAYKDERGYAYVLRGEGKHVCEDVKELLSPAKRALADSPEGKEFQLKLFEFIVENREDRKHVDLTFKVTYVRRVFHRFDGLGASYTERQLFKVCLSRLKEHGLIEVKGVGGYQHNERYYKITDKGWERWRARNK